MFKVTRRKRFMVSPFLFRYYFWWSGREEQAEPESLEEVTKVAALLGVDAEIFVETLMKPKLKVGKDYVKKGQNKDQVFFSADCTRASLVVNRFTICLIIFFYHWVNRIMDDLLFPKSLFLL